MYQLAELFGIVVYDNKPHMKYRIHEGNTIGISSPTQELVDKIKRQFTTSNVPRRSEIAQNVLSSNWGNRIEFYPKRGKCILTSLIVY